MYKCLLLVFVDVKHHVYISVQLYNQYYKLCSRWFLCSCFSYHYIIILSSNNYHHCHHYHHYYSSSIFLSSSAFCVQKQTCLHV